MQMSPLMKSTAAFSKKPSFKDTSIHEPISEIALLLGSMRGSEWRPGGTATIIAPHIAVTARHVVENDWRSLEGRALPSGKSQSTFSMVAIQMLSRGTEGSLWDVRKIWFSSHCDVAYLLLAAANNNARQYKWRPLGVNLVPPTIGSRISAFGYRGNEVDTSNHPAITWKSMPTTSVGEVTQIHCLQGEVLYTVNTKFSDGMSGGPVIGDDGRIWGVIRSTMKHELGGDTALVNALWPSMDILIDIDNSGQPCASYPILELARKNIIQAQGYEKIDISKGDDGLTSIVKLTK